MWRSALVPSTLYAQSWTNFPGIEDTITDPNTPTNDVGISDRFQQIAINDITTGEDIRDLIITVVVDVVIPLAILAWIIIAIIGFIKLMASTTAEGQQTALKYLLWWIIGIVIMLSAWYITNEFIVGDGDTISIIDRIRENIGWTGANLWTKVAEAIYIQFAYPFLKVLLALALGVLFIFVLINSYKYLFKGDDGFQKRAFTVLVYTVVGIIVIVLAQTIVELIYGKYEEVIGNCGAAWGDDLWCIGWPVFDNPNLDTVYVVINWILGIAAFIMVILILYQGYKMLVNPNDDENMKSLWKTLLYMIIGIFVVWWAYLIVNFFIFT